ncbi:hypothetical protein REH81_05060 [Vibrio rotiferianus]
MHDITPKSKHIIVPVTLAMHSTVTDIDTAADGLNELLRGSVDAGFIADYKFVTTNNETVTSSVDPQEGELFEGPIAINTFLYPDSISPDVESKLVWVTAGESLNSCSFDWYFDKKVAADQFEKDKRVVPLGETQCHFFAYQVEASKTNEEITDEIDSFYADNSVSREFNEHSLVTGFPFSPEGWLAVAAEHQKFLNKSESTHN